MYSVSNNHLKSHLRQYYVSRSKFSELPAAPRERITDFQITGKAKENFKLYRRHFPKLAEIYQ